MLAEAMLKVAHDDELAKEMGRNGKGPFWERGSSWISSALQVDHRKQMKRMPNLPLLKLLKDG